MHKKEHMTRWHYVYKHLNVIGIYANQCAGGAVIFAFVLLFAFHSA